MPRNYDEYLYGSLCQSEDESNPVPQKSHPNVRRKSLSEGLAPISIVVEGNGVLVKMRVKPHVRWTKVLSKWSANFEGEAPMAWPVFIHIPDQFSSIPCKSIQESISRTLGPELLETVSDKDPAFTVKVGGESPPPEEPTSCDVEPPVIPEIPAIQTETNEDIQEPQVPANSTSATLAVPDTSVPPNTKTTYKIRIESEVFKKTIKMSVSGGCTISRLIRKYLEALKQQDLINPEIVHLSYLDKPIESLGLPVAEIFDDTCVLLTAFIGSQKSTPKRRRSSEKQTSQDEQMESESISEQAQEIAYWEQVRSVRKGVADQVDIDEEDLALAIAMSLSTEMK